MQILSQSTPTAKKKHRCNFCGLPINPGEKYETQFIENCGDAYPWKSHPSCSELASKLDMYRKCDEDGVTESDFFEIVTSEYFNITGICWREAGTWIDALELVKKHVLTT